VKTVISYSISVKYNIVWFLLRFTKIGRIKPVYEVVGCLSLYTQSKKISVPHACIDSEFISAQSMIARLALNLLKSRDALAVLQRSIAFDAFPL